MPSPEASLTDEKSLSQIVSEGLAQGLALAQIQDKAAAFARQYAAGYVQGYRVMRREMVLKLIDKRFGPLPSWVARHIQCLPENEMESVICKALSASTLDEVL